MMFIFENIRHRNELLYYFGLAALIGAIITAILTQTTTMQINGVNAFNKPMKFFISSFFFAWTLGFYGLYLQNQHAVKIFSWVTTIGLGYELLAITFQASRGKLSHYNRETPFDAAILWLMIIAIIIVTLATLYIGILFFIQQKFDTNDVVIWSIRLSIILTVIFAFEGFAMGSMSKHTVGALDGTEGLPLVNWSKKHGDLRIAHFLGLHAIQLVPLVSYYLAKSTLHVFLIAAAYLVLTTYTLIIALSGKVIF